MFSYNEFGCCVQRVIVGFRRDEEGHWVAELECGHTRHVRHDPPWQNRPWVMSEEGRAEFLGTALNCVRCDADPSILQNEDQPGVGSSRRRALEITATDG